MDEAGFLLIESRENDMVKSESQRIAPQEIENVIMELSPIHEVAVVGHVDDILSEKIVAFIVLKNDAESSTKELNHHC